MSRDDYTPARLRELADNAFDTEFRELQAALRAAADTLAAREALLTKALDVLEDHFLHRRLALAAEIAAALGKETDNG